MMIGSLTKNASSGDINPIGSICKKHILQFLQYCQVKFNYHSLKSIIEENIKKEESLEITGEEMIMMSKLRKEYKTGPYSMLRSLINIWKDKTPFDNGKSETILYEVFHK